MISIISIQSYSAVEMNHKTNQDWIEKKEFLAIITRHFFHLRCGEYKFEPWIQVTRNQGKYTMLSF